MRTGCCADRKSQEEENHTIRLLIFMDKSCNHNPKLKGDKPKKTYMMPWKGPPRMVCPKYLVMPTLTISGIWQESHGSKSHSLDSNSFQDIYLYILINPGIPDLKLAWQLAVRVLKSSRIFFWCLSTVVDDVMLLLYKEEWQGAYTISHLETAQSVISHWGKGVKPVSKTSWSAWVLPALS